MGSLHTETEKGEPDKNHPKRNDAIARSAPFESIVFPSRREFHSKYTQLRDGPASDNRTLRWRKASKHARTHSHAHTKIAPARARDRGGNVRFTGARALVTHACPHARERTRTCVSHKSQHLLRASAQQDAINHTTTTTTLVFVPVGLVF